MGLREGGGNCQKYLKRRWNRKEGRGNKDFENGVKLGEGVGALKRGGLEPPYELWRSIHGCYVLGLTVTIKSSEFPNFMYKRHFFPEH